MTSIQNQIVFLLEIYGKLSARGVHKVCSEITPNRAGAAFRSLKHRGIIFDDGIDQAPDSQSHHIPTYSLRDPDYPSKLRDQIKAEHENALKAAAQAEIDEVPTDPVLAAHYRMMKAAKKAGTVRVVSIDAKEHAQKDPDQSAAPVSKPVADVDKAAPVKAVAPAINGKAKNADPAPKQETEKECTVCHKILPIDEFSRNGVDYRGNERRHTRCKTCANIELNKYRKKRKNAETYAYIY